MATPHNTRPPIDPRATDTAGAAARPLDSTSTRDAHRPADPYAATGNSTTVHLDERRGDGAKRSGMSPMVLIIGALVLGAIALYFLFGTGGTSTNQPVSTAPSSTTAPSSAAPADTTAPAGTTIAPAESTTVPADSGAPTTAPAEGGTAPLD